MKFITGLLGEVLTGNPIDPEEYAIRTHPKVIAFLEQGSAYLTRETIKELSHAEPDAYIPEDVTAFLSVVEIPTGTRFTYRPDPEYYSMILTFDHQERWRIAH